MKAPKTRIEPNKIMARKMVQSKIKETGGRWYREMIPAVLVFIFSIIFSLYIGDHFISGGWKIVYRILLRFFRYTLLLCLPLYLLRPIYRFILEKGKGGLIQLGHPGEITIHPFKHWLFRPFQGIGIGFLFATKLLVLIQTITGPLTGPTPPIISGQYQLGRMLLVTLITIIISLLLSTLWTLDDMGIRYHNRRDQELKMIGKYVGTIMPLIFGLFGLFSLLAHYPKENTLLHVFRIILAFYPPLVVFAVIHTHFITGKIDFHARKDLLKKGGVWQG
jgi:hypothetical protein